MPISIRWGFYNFCYDIEWILTILDTILMMNGKESGQIQPKTLQDCTYNYSFESTSILLLKWVDTLIFITLSASSFFQSKPFMHNVSYYLMALNYANL